MMTVISLIFANSIQKEIGRRLVGGQEGVECDATKTFIVQGNYF